MKLTDTIYETYETGETSGIRVKVSIDVTALDDADRPDAIDIFEDMIQSVESELSFIYAARANAGLMDADPTDSDTDCGCGCDHRLSGALPLDVPTDAPRDENNDAVFDEATDEDVRDAVRIYCHTCSHYTSTEYANNGDESVFMDCPDCGLPRPSKNITTHSDGDATDA